MKSQFHTNFGTHGKIENQGEERRKGKKKKKKKSFVVIEGEDRVSMEEKK